MESTESLRALDPRARKKLLESLLEGLDVDEAAGTAKQQPRQPHDAGQPQLGDGAAGDDAPEGSGGGTRFDLAAKPDVVLDVSKLKVSGVKLTIEALNAELSVRVRMAQLLDLHVGLDARIEKVDVEVDEMDTALEVGASLARLERILEHVFSSVVQNPEVFRQAMAALDQAPGRGDADDGGV